MTVLQILFNLPQLPENLNAVNGRQMKSIDVMTAVLGYMISHIKTEAVFQGLPLTPNYVLTIPTCACKDSRTFMTEAALKVIKVYKLFSYL